jgi:hypothetical protein
MIASNATGYVSFLQNGTIEQQAVFAGQTLHGWMFLREFYSWTGLQIAMEEAPRRKFVNDE